MRADLATLLTVLVATAPVALADEPVVIPPVPDPSCQCGPNGEWVPCTQCSTDSSAPSTPKTNQQQGVPPILKVAVGAVVVTVVGGMFAIAPGHTVDLFSKSSTSKAQARGAWNDVRARLDALERAYVDAVRLDRDLDRTLEIARTPIRDRATGYVAIDAPAPPAKWSPSGACGRLVTANDELLASMDRRAMTEARDQFPTWASAVGKAKQQAVAVIARAAGADKLLKQAKELQSDYARAKEMDAFLKELSKCQETKAVDPTSNCEAIIYDRVNAELKVFMDELGAGDAHERVRKFSAFYRGYVSDLGGEVQKQALWTARCR